MQLSKKYLFLAGLLFILTGCSFGSPQAVCTMPNIFKSETNPDPTLTKTYYCCNSLNPTWISTRCQNVGLPWAKLCTPEGLFQNLKTNGHKPAEISCTFEGA